MLERYFTKPQTADRIKESWIGQSIEKYVVWLSDQGYAARTVHRRVPLLRRFGEVAWDLGAREIKELPELPNLTHFKKVIMRLAPYPSGALHIGNARMIILNDEYTKRYNGDLILFYDDTIGSPKSLRNSPKAKYVLPEAFDLIKEGLEWLGVKYTKILEVLFK